LPDIAPRVPQRCGGTDVPSADGLSDLKQRGCSNPAEPRGEADFGAMLEYT
jgi:hypothetical protein